MKSQRSLVAGVNPCNLCVCDEIRIASATKKLKSRKKKLFFISTNQWHRKRKLLTRIGSCSRCAMSSTTNGDYYYRLSHFQLISCIQIQSIVSTYLVSRSNSICPSIDWLKFDFWSAERNDSKLVDDLVIYQCRWSSNFMCNGLTLNFTILTITLWKSRSLTDFAKCRKINCTGVRCGPHIACH